MSSALILLAPGFEEIEAVTLIDLLRRAGVTVTVAGLKKQVVCGSHAISIKADVYYKKVDPLRFDVLILPGGQPGSSNLKANAEVLEWVKARFIRGKKLAAICAAPTVLAAAGITKGLKITSYPSEKEVFKNSIYVEESIVRDHEVFTSRGVGTAIRFALFLIAELQGEAIAEEIRKRILFEN